MKFEEREIREGLKNLDNTVRTTYWSMLTYYKTFDSLHGTHHIDILRKIYECEQRFTIDGIALNCNVSRRTLDRNRKEYLACFTICKNLYDVSDEAAATANG